METIIGYFVIKRITLMYNLVNTGTQVCKRNVSSSRNKIFYIFKIFKINTFTKKNVNLWNFTTCQIKLILKRIFFFK